MLNNNQSGSPNSGTRKGYACLCSALCVPLEKIIIYYFSQLIIPFAEKLEDT